MEEEYEDAFAPDKDGERNGYILRFAVADGATEGMQSGKWAEILVRTFSRSKEHPAEIGDFLARVYETWTRWQRHYLKFRQQHKPIQWFEEAGFQRGAFSTFLGLTLAESKKHDGRWEAVILGDTCLFQVRGESLITQIPINQSSEFNNRPFLVPSKDTDREKVLSAIKIFDGNYQSNDRFYIMTDALACWFMLEHEEGNRPWIILRDLGMDGGQEFKEWISQLRKNKLVRNDDVTLVRIDVF